MKPKRIAINGLGRIGRTVLRQLVAQDTRTLQVVAVNDLVDVATLAHLLKYDSTYGPLVGTVQHDANTLTVLGHRMQVYAAPDPSALPWRALDIDIVLEATGRFVAREQADLHRQAGARHVVISAPAKGEVPTVVLGVNDHLLASAPPILSNASCTTNCLAPMVKVLDEHFGIERGFITTVHAYTADQNLQDGPHKDLRRARAAAQSIIPTTTGAARAIGLVLPHLQGKLDGMAMRVPVANGSVVDLTVALQKSATSVAINEAMWHAADHTLQGIMAYTEDPIVSVDIIGNPHSCVFDASLTHVQHNLAKVIGWYDNEGGYAQRLIEVMERMG